MNFIISIFLSFFIMKLAEYMARKDNLSETDFSREKNYYRDILKKYTPAELSYVDNFIVNSRREIVSTILNLQLKRKIAIRNNKIVILDNNIDELRKTEKYIMKNIRDGIVEIDDSGYIDSYAQDEAIEDGLVQKNDEKIKDARKSKVKNIFITISSILVIFVMLVYSNDFIFEFLMEKGFFIVNPISTVLEFIFGEIVFLGIYALMQENSYRRTTKGEDINIKIEGLRKFIKDYTLLKDKEREEILVWEEYLIYSLILGINKSNIIEDVMELVNIKYESTKILK